MEFRKKLIESVNNDDIETLEIKVLLSEDIYNLILSQAEKIWEIFEL